MTTGFVINHVWQSSCFGLLAAILAFMLRGNSPKVRYWVWLSASLKFLVPWVLLVSLGSVLPQPRHRVGSVVTSSLPALVQLAEPFSPDPYTAVPSRGQIHWDVTALASLWAAGFIAIAFARCRNWYGIRAMLRAGTPVELPIAVPALVTPGAHEPGVVGFLRPVLVLPAFLLERLSPKQLDALLAHELTHVRRRDNIFAAIHMGVEAIFWFHPLVWWIGSRMLEERELACDEEVLRQGCEPADYVQGILTVCRHYSEAPLPCVSGVTGADVKKRLQTILRGCLASELNGYKKLALAFAAVAAIWVPVGLGVWNAPAPLTAQEMERFEVVSIKPHPDPIDFIRDTFDGVSYRATGLTLLSLIEDAYKMGRFQISGGPNWLTSAHFDVEAKASGSVPLTHERARPMLQAMLSDRFQLKVRRAMREVPCYDMVTAKGGPKLEENTDPGPPGGVAASADVNGGHVRADSGTMARLAMNLAVPAGRPIVDKTGLAGKYHIALDYAADNSPEAADGTMPTLFPALEDQLGLKLVPSRTTLDTLVIESVQKPSDN